MVLISRELQSLLNTNTSTVNVNTTSMYGRADEQLQYTTGDRKNLLVTYFKRRVVGIVFMVIVLMLLLITSLFTDLGFNIGQLIYDWVSNFLGF